MRINNNQSAITGKPEAMQKHAAKAKPGTLGADSATIPQDSDKASRKLAVAQENLAATGSQISGPDQARQMTQLTIANIRQHMGQAVTAQGNVNPQRATELLD